MRFDGRPKPSAIGTNIKRLARRRLAQAAARPAAGNAVEGLEPRRLMASTPIISEFVAINTTGLTDETGARGDWIELHNPGAGALNLAGYTLTDDPADPDKWTLPAVTVQGGGYLTLFADEKNRTNPAATLHANFSLGGDGGYVGLFAPGAATPLSSYNYPQQVADRSYGIGVSTDTSALVGPRATARAAVPANGTLGTAWTAHDFNDAGWAAGTTGAGYETTAAAPLVSGFLVRMVDTNANINTITEAAALLDGTASPDAFPVLFNGLGTRATVNFGGGSFGPGASFGGDQPLINGVVPSTPNTHPGREHFALRSTADVTIPAGTWTVNVGSDDGMRLRIPGVSFANRRNENTSGTATPSPADTLVRNANGVADTSATFTLASPLATTLGLDYYDLNGPDGVELSIAPGQRDAFTTSVFSLLQDGAHGWSVKSAQQPVPGFSVRMVDTNGGTDGSITHIGEAAAILDGTAAPGAFTVVTDMTANRPAINLGSAGYAGADMTLPNGSGGTTNDENTAARENYALRIGARLAIPAGTYTIAAGTDDGFRLRIPGVTFANRYGENFTGAASPSPADTLVYGGTRGILETSAVFTVPAGGLSTTLQLDAFECNGGDGVELWLASGSRTGTLTTNGGAHFSLLRDGLFGWGVQDASVPATPDYSGLLGTNLLAPMRGVNASAYVRVPFSSAGGPGDHDALRLKMKYDDGFVAYLNGVEVARRNAPAGQAWSSAATASRNDADALAYETIEVPRSALRVGSNVLAIHGLNDAVNGDDFLIYPELEAFRTRLGVETYFTPTPGVANGTGTSLQFVADTKFGRDRGFYDAPFALAITTATADAQIRYTLDGSPPTATTGTVYAGPITIDRTTTLRAAAFKPGWVASNVDTQTYIFVGDVKGQAADGQPPAGWPTTWGSNVVDYGMDPDIVTDVANRIPDEHQLRDGDLKAIPSISIVLKQDDMFGSANGIYANPGGDERAWERAASIELLNPDGTEGFQSNAGIRIRGGFSRSTSNPKHGFRLFFRGEYGDSELDYPMFGPGGADSFQKFDLRSANNYSWSVAGDRQFTYLRDQFSRDTQLALSGTGERGDYYHLYINGMYWGIYNSGERPEANYGASYFGGNADEYDVIKVDPDLGYNIEATDGNFDAWNEMYGLAKLDLSQEANYQRLLGNNPDGTRNPAYKVLVDRDNLIDYMLVIFYGGNKDAPISDFLSNANPNNFFAVRNRTGQEGWRFFAHDSEHTLLTNETEINRDRTGPYPAGDGGVNKSNPQWLFQKLMANANFKSRFADHVQQHFTGAGALTPASVAARLGRRVAQLDRAIVAESARWGDAKVSTPHTRATWLAEVNRLITGGPGTNDSYVERRTAIVLQQFATKGWLSTVAAPTFSRPGGVVPAGTAVTLANPSGAGTIYYTLDGSDPRGLDGSPAATAQAYAQPIVVDQTRQIFARVLNAGVWSAAEQRTYSLDAGSLRVSEVMYNPATPAGGTALAAQDYEFVELLNTGTTPIDLSGVRFTAGITASLANVSLAPGARAVVVRNQAAFQSRYGTSIPIVGVYGKTDTNDASGDLDNGGERVTLLGAAGQTLVDFTYDDAWYPLTDAGGYSLVANDPAGPVAALNTKQGWRNSNALHGAPGAADPGVATGSVVINEVLTRTAGAIGDWIELHNTTGAALNIGGWFLSDNAADLRRYQIPAGTTIAPGRHLVFNARDHFGTAGNPGVNTSFGLSEMGETVYLSSNDGAGNAGGYRESESFAAIEPELTFGRYIPAGGGGGAEFTALLAPTPGAPNSGPRVGPVVINEIMYSPATGKAEYFELRNLSNQPVPLYDPQNPGNAWRLTAGATYTFPFGASIPANGYAVVAAVAADTFRAQYAVPAGVQVFGAFTGALDNSGERITLSRPGVPEGALIPLIVADSVKYEVAALWPARTDGRSISRINSGVFGTDPSNFALEAAGGTPGRLNLDAAGPVADILDVTPDPHTGPVDAVTIAFDEPVSQVDLADLRLARDGVDVPLAGGASGSATLASADGMTYVLGNLAARTANPGAYVISLATSGTGIVDFGGRPLSAGASDAFTVVATAQPAVASVVINDGNAQRSRVRQITVGFDRDVVLDAGAISLARTAGGPALSIPLVVTPVNGGGAGGVAATYTVAFASPHDASLPDGIYTLTIAGGKVHAGSAAGPAMAADYTSKFHRLFADADGDGDVDNADRFDLRGTTNKRVGSPAFKWYFDFDADGDVDNADLFEVRRRARIAYRGY